MNIGSKIASYFNFKKPKGEDQDFHNFIVSSLGFRVKDITPYITAFTHCSLGEMDLNNNPINYERLEFLGDSILGSVIAVYLHRNAPHGNEGYLTKMKAKIVSRKNLNRLGKELKLLDQLKSKVRTTQFGDNIYGNLLESLIGAIFIDRGYQYCERFIHEKIISSITTIEILENKIISYKSLIIELFQKDKDKFNFETYEDTGKQTQRHFSVKLWVNGKVMSKGRATSKKKAEEIASKRAYYKLQKEIEN